MNWFIVVYFLIGDSWINAEKLNKEGWSKIKQPNFAICLKKINEANKRFEKIAESKNTKLDIKFKCECLENVENIDQINCKPRNFFQRILDNLKLT